jgi:hypothetical protein
MLSAEKLRVGGMHMLDYLLSGGQVVVGLGVLVVWWLTLALMGRLYAERRLSGLMFAFVPCVFLLWLVSGSILVLRGLGFLG